MKRPSSAASQRYSGQCSLNARHIRSRDKVVARGVDTGLSELLRGRGHRPRLQRPASRPDSFDVELHAIQAAARTEVESFSVSIPPCEIVRMFRWNDRAEMFSFW